ncbi:Mov34/MPN/PAD-1 family protein [Mucilaginibacter roseus]|uniref:Mov34/MPN/PAD-1 family protein n=1 Tax=Mucilaginibacter roseus TaxID=1528868 RepID=A0ABS8U0U6_9SPHI|nr:Mov34/MPN/PAD-1 family protein [Mucilaginibacter roseus]MCD8739700.1 Mov34/MPN/PAD-1 family protein [Mucilaginibacter roseus]
MSSIETVGREHYPKEFGGILIGYYMEGQQQVIITGTLLPDDYRSSPSSFERGDKGLKERLKAVYEEEKPKIYVGEWHTHPNAAPIPSYTDLNALKEIVASDAVSIDHPIMLILGLDRKKCKPAFYVYMNKRTYSYENI